MTDVGSHDDAALSDNEDDVEQVALDGSNHAEPEGSNRAESEGSDRAESEGSNRTESEGSNRAEPEAAAIKPYLQWTPENIQTPEMERVGIIVNSAAKVIICVSCRSVVKPLTLHNHINHTHRPLTATHKFCSDLTREYNIIEDPQRQNGIKPPIFGLPLYPKFLACDACGAAFKTRGSILRHVRETGDCSSASHQECHAQAYFPGSNRMFFGVDVPSMTPAASTNISVTLIKKLYSPPPFHAIPITAAKSFRDANHFLRVEHWEQHVEGMTGEGIQKVVREREPELREVVLPIVETYAKDMVKELSSTDHAVKVAIGDYNG